MIVFKFVKFMKSLWYRIANLGMTLCLTSSVALGFASVIGGMYLKSVALLSVSCAAVGCFLSGIFFHTFLAKLLDMSKSQSDDGARHAINELEKQLEEMNAVNEDQQSAISKKDAEISSLRAECTRLGKQRIDVTALRPVLELALAEVSMNIKDVKIEWDSKSFRKESSTLGFSSPAECKQYTGVIEQEFKAKFGIDMKRLTVNWSPEKRTITVYGMKAVHIGNQDERFKWLLREVKTFKLKNRGNDEKFTPMKKDTADGFWQNCNWYEKDQTEIASASLDLNEIKNNYEEQERVLRRRVSEGGGEEFKPIQDYVVNMGKAVIRCLFAPMLKAYDAEIAFSENPNESGESLEEFLTAYNNSSDQLQKQITGGVGDASDDVKMVQYHNEIQRSGHADDR